MKMLSLCAVLAVVGAACLSPVAAQTTSRPYNAPATARPNNAPAQQNSNGPFGTQWAKPPGTTGSQIYNDPRTRDPNSSLRSQRGKGCLAPAIYDPASGGCR